MLQQFSKEETGRILGCGYRTVERLFPEALDRVSEVLLRRGILAGLPSTKHEVRKSCQAGKNGPFSQPTEYNPNIFFKIWRVYPLNLILNLDHKDLQEGALTAARPNFLVQEIKNRVGEPSQGNDEESQHKQGTQDSKESFNVQKKALKQVDLGRCPRADHESGGQSRGGNGRDHDGRSR
jgi:hypothetical protein